MDINITILITELIFFSSFLDEIIRVKGVGILQEGLYEGTETCWKVLMCVYLLHFANMRKKKKTTARRHL
jgi:hypothetical protein